MALEKYGTEAFRIMHTSPYRILYLVFIMVEGSLNRRGSKYDSMLGPEISSYDENDGLCDFYDGKYG